MTMQLQNMSIEKKETGEVVITIPNIDNHLYTTEKGNSVVATSGGNVLIPGTDVKIGINAFRKGATTKAGK